MYGDITLDQFLHLQNLRVAEELEKGALAECYRLLCEEPLTEDEEARCREIITKLKDLIKELKEEGERGGI